MQQRQKASQQLAAARAGFSVRTAHRIEHGCHQPKCHQPRTGRTRPDPLVDVWQSELVPLLRRAPALRPMTLWEYLQQKYPGQYPHSVMRTLQRRVQQWKATEGPPKEVMFRQEHLPGVKGLSDFTKLKQVSITLNGQRFDHLLYHYRLAYSGWSYVMVVQGGESFAALSEGLQNALSACGGCPQEHRTDSLSAAYRNLLPAAKEDVTEAYQKLCLHYNMTPSRNNRGKGHENGSIESPHGHFKRRLAQALLLRGSCDFASIAEYQAFIDQVIARLNALHEAEFALERTQLQPLPATRHADYRLLLLKVSPSSTITVGRTLYTVPSRLIGRTLCIHLYHDRLLGYLGSVQVLSLPRIYPHPASGNQPRARAIDYRHVIDSLYKKPRAFAGCKYRDDLLPNEHYRQLWQRIGQQFDLGSACKLIVTALWLAAKLNVEAAVAAYLEAELEQGTLTLERLKCRFQTRLQVAVPPNRFGQHSLEGYDTKSEIDTPFTIKLPSTSKTVFVLGLAWSLLKGFDID